MQSPHTLSIEQVAEALGFTRATFDRRRHKLEASGFPRPLPGAGARWSKTLVLAWIDRGGAAAGADARIAGTDSYIADVSAALAQRYPGRAA